MSGKWSDHARLLVRCDHDFNSHNQVMNDS